MIEKVKFIKLSKDATFLNCTIVEERTELVTYSESIKHVCINNFKGEYEFESIIDTKPKLGRAARLNKIGENEKIEDKLII